MEHHTVCYVVFLGRTSLCRHGRPQIGCTGPCHQCDQEERTVLLFQLSARSMIQGSCSTEQVSTKCYSHRMCCVPHRSTHRVNILDFLPRDKWFVLRNCCWEGRKKNSLFYYSEVHFNLHKRHCVCDGLHEGKHYSPASSARKKIREIWGGLKTTYCNAEF